MKRYERKLWFKGWALSAWFVFFIGFQSLWPSYVIAASEEEQKEKMEAAAAEGSSLGDSMLLQMLMTMFSQEEDQPWEDTFSLEESQAQLEALQGLYSNPEGMGAAGVAGTTDLSNGSSESALAYQATQDANANPEYQGLQQTNIEDDIVWAQTTSLINGTSPVLSEILTGCTTTNTDGEVTEEQEYFNSDVQYCTQARKLETGQCDVKREVTFVPVETKVIYSVTVTETLNQDPNTPNPFTCPGVEAYDQCMQLEAEQYDECFRDQCRHIIGQPDPCPQCTEQRQQGERWCAIQYCSKPGLSGEFVISEESIGEPRFEETEIQELDVEIEVTPFPETVILNEAGSYFVGSYNLIFIAADSGGTGTGELNDGGNVENGWDYTYTANVNNVKYFAVQATLYEIQENTFISESCSDASARAINDGMCTGTLSCTDETQCRIIDGVEVCETGAMSGVAELLAEWGDPDINNMCWGANADITQCVGGQPACLNGECGCDSLTGDEYTQCIQNSCYVDVNGDLICPTEVTGISDWVNNLGDEGWVDNCEEQLANDKCVILEERPCSPDGEGDSGECYDRDVIFECGETVTFGGQVTGGTSSTSCDAAISCMGDDCNSYTPESNEDFQEAMLAASVANFGQSETDCPDPTNPDTCRIFVGKSEWCKEPRGVHDDIGLVPNCCEMAEEMAGPVSDMQLYMQLIMQGQANGAWSAVGGFLYENVDAVASAWDSVTSIFGQTAGSSVGATASGWSPFAQWTADILADALPEAMSDAIFDTAVDGTVQGFAEGPVGELIGMIAQALSLIMMIYMIYNFIKIILSLLPGFKCEDEELQFGQKLVLGSCHYVGKKCAKRVWNGFINECISDKRVFCCYNSPLARIINEQIKGQSVPPDERSSYTGPEWGDVDNPECGGLSVTEVQNINWDDIDLSEWYAIMEQAGFIPNPDEFNAPVSWESSNVYFGDEPPEGYIWDNDIEQNIDELADIIADQDPDCDPFTGNGCDVNPGDTGGGDSGGGDSGGGDSGGGDSGGGDSGGGDSGGGDSGGGDSGGGDSGGGDSGGGDNQCDPDNGEIEGCFEERPCDPENGDWAGCPHPSPDPEP